ncbi:hypothetical protein PCANC_01043 [Puccinia coronata f. sp. avenae]|uniref:Uncharacterized protein n=1 Tax=Puccinia coronata f. sp. avenae TaxID=200324 RepID=A0A2N5W6H5_9BASI|nr:hypothetical protein PCANC_01043 [Puccinia coronata f. sp. avenae]
MPAHFRLCRPLASRTQSSIPPYHLPQSLWAPLPHALWCSTWYLADSASTSTILISIFILQGLKNSNPQELKSPPFIFLGPNTLLILLDHPHSTADQETPEGSSTASIPSQRCRRPSTGRSSTFGPPSRDRTSDLKIYSLGLWF